MFPLPPFHNTRSRNLICRFPDESLGTLQDVYLVTISKTYGDNALGALRLQLALRAGLPLLTPRILILEIFDKRYALVLFVLRLDFRHIGRIHALPDNAEINVSPKSGGLHDVIGVLHRSKW
ncbi:Uncharacterised protein [Burkholderia pseudomallei]|nr:Uncharacterised protein [Burkholderia pseudomallei]CAJ4837961.1 Uncharacterised protein [Burkholderia pseudomallei]